MHRRTSRAKTVAALAAVYDAVGAIDRTHRPYLSSPPARWLRWNSFEPLAR